MIDLEELKKDVGRARREASVFFHRKQEADEKKTREEGEAEERAGGITADEYVAKYSTSYEDDVSAVNMVTNMTHALIAIAERLER